MADQALRQPVSDLSLPQTTITGRTWQLWLLGVLGALAPFNLTFGAESAVVLRLRPLVVAGLVVSLLLAFTVARKRARRDYDLVDFACAWWLIGVWLAALTSGDRWLGGGGASRISIAVLLVFVTRSLVIKRGAATFVIRALALGCAAGAALGLVLWAWSSLDSTAWFVGQATTLGSEPRLTHPWAHANIAAMAIIGSGAGAAVLRNRAASIAALGVLVLALVSTASRGGLVAAVVMAIVWLSVRRSRRDALIILALVAVAGVMIATTDVWRSRIANDVTQLGYSAQLEPPERLSTGGDPISVAVTNNGTAAWQRGGNEQVLLSARWLDDQGSILAEDWWPLPTDVSAGDSVQMQIAIEPRTPVGLYQVQWDMIVPNVLYFDQSAAKPPILTDVVVPTSSVTADSVAEYARARSQVRLGRADTWRLAWDEFNNSPVLGVGPGQFGRSTQSEGQDSRVVAGSHAHNIVLQPLVSWGLVGAVPFFVLLGYASLRVLSQLRSRRSLNLTIVIVSMLGLAVHGLVDWPLVSVGTCIPAGIIIGLATSRGDIR